jgi:molecular chaperone DnaJ
VQLKDYYTILELPSSASVDEIKKAWRRLAHQYHPDKKANDPYAAAQFAAIKEAYETLINPVKKNLYLQQRWYAKSRGQQAAQSVVTPVTILKQLLELDRYIHQLDEHRMDKEGLYHYLMYIIQDENIRQLNTFNETVINRQVVMLVLRCSRLLPSSFLPGLAERLKKIDAGEEALTGTIDRFARQRQQADYWEKRKIWLVLLVVLLLCAGIFITARN